MTVDYPTLAHGQDYCCCYYYYYFNTEAEICTPKEEASSF